MAILESKPNAIFLKGVNEEELLFKAQRGFYRAFWDRGFSVDFITPDQLNEKTLHNYKAICLPLMGLLDESRALLLENYVKKGGILFGTSRLATLDEKGWTHFDLPLKSLGNIFGILKIEADTFTDQKIEYKDQFYTPSINRDLLMIDDTTEVLATYSDGYPAITRARLGDGFGVYISTQADIGLLENPTSSLLGNIVLDQFLYQPTLSMTGDFSRPGYRSPYPGNK